MGTSHLTQPTRPSHSILIIAIRSYHACSIVAPWQLQVAIADDTPLFSRQGLAGHAGALPNIQSTPELLS